MPGNLTLPIAVLNKKPPVHRICILCLMPDRQTLATGTSDGQICLWILNEKHGDYTPKHLLFGHTTSILCLAPAGVDPDCKTFLSCSQSGKVCLWDSEDGRCIESTNSTFIHTSAQAHAFTEISGAGKIFQRLLCIGHYSEILVMDPETLQICFSLSSRVEPDWLSAFHVVKPPHKPDVVVGVSNAGMVKIWSLGSIEKKTLSNPVYEDESKQVKCFGACSLVLCRFNPRTMLIVCQKTWQVFDAFDFSLCCSGASENKGNWLGGEFLTVDRIVLWASNGCAYLCQLPKKNLKGKALKSMEPDSHDENFSDTNAFYYCVLKVMDTNVQSLHTNATFAFRHFSSVDAKPDFSDMGQCLIIRGDVRGRLAVWTIPDIDEKRLVAFQQEKFSVLPELAPASIQSLAKLWSETEEQCPGILGCYDELDKNDIPVTSTLYVALRGSLVLGRQDGTIVLASGIRTLARTYLFMDERLKAERTAPLRLLSAHNGPVTSLLYPFEENSRYEPNHFVSGGADFCVCLIDLNSNAVLHRFCVQAGEILRLVVPPPNCSSKVSQSVCSIAADHSVALLGLKDQKCVLLASRHLFPVAEIKWRPLDDFLLIRCEDNTVYVWQIETAYLDRVLNGIVAEEAMLACNEQMDLYAPDEKSEKLVGPARGRFDVDWRKYLEGAPPMVVQGVRCNQMDAEFHVVLFNVESLIVAITTESICNDTEASEPVQESFQSGLSLSPRFSGILSRAKESAGSLLKASLLGRDDADVSLNEPSSKHTGFNSSAMLYNKNSELHVEIAHFLTSILQSWTLDSDLDAVCRLKLGLCQPKRPILFGLVSKEGHLTLTLPDRRHWAPSPLGSKVDVGDVIASNLDSAVKISTCRVNFDDGDTPAPTIEPKVSAAGDLYGRQHRGGRVLHVRRWTASRLLTTQQLLAVVSLADASASADGLSFSDEYAKLRRILKHSSSRSNIKRHAPSSRLASSTPTSVGGGVNLAAAATSSPLPLSVDVLEKFVAEQSLVKQAWNTVASVHCMLLPELVQAGYKPPVAEQLARRWRDRCPQIRDAAQTLLLRELNRIGPEGRKSIVEKWSRFLPTAVDPSISILTPPPADSLGHSAADFESSVLSLDKGNLWNEPAQRLTRRNQATCVILLGVIGAEYGQDLVSGASVKTTPRHRQVVGGRTDAPLEGFTNVDYELARVTSQSLLELLLQPPSHSLPPYAAIRRAAIDLIGRGFLVWQPYLDISKVLLALLELCAVEGSPVASSSAIPVMTSLSSSLSFASTPPSLPPPPLSSMTSPSLPLTPEADACAAARRALTQIAMARPPAFVTALGKEVTRFNAMSQHQAVYVGSPLVRAKAEILKILETIAEKMYGDMIDLMIPTGEILVHCMDSSTLKRKNICETFSFFTKFPMIAYCNQSRRLCFGGKTGAAVIHELRIGKSQTIQAHSKAVSACDFSEDGKHLATYSADEGKVNFWQVSQPFMGMGQSQVKCVKQYAAPTSYMPGVNNLQHQISRLSWISAKAVTLTLPSGAEHRFSL